MTTTSDIKLGTLDYAAIVLLALSAVVAFALANDEIDVDDAYISYRYASHLAAGHGLVYNVGERVYGSTSLLWVAWLALWIRLTSLTAEQVSSWSILLFLPGNLLVVYLLARRLTQSRLLALLGGLLSLSSPFFLLIATCGMETILYTLLILSVLLAFALGRWLLTGIIAGLAFATRPDGLALIVALLMVTVARDVVAVSALPPASRLTEALRKRGGWLALGFCAVAIPFLLFCLAYYGSPLPNTLSAKRMQGFVSNRWWMLLHFVKGPGWPVLASAVMALPLGLGVVRAQGTPTRGDYRVETFVAALAWFVLYVGAWVTVRIDLYPWYIAAMGPCSAVVVLFPVALTARPGMGRAVQAALIVMALAVCGYWAGNAYRDVTGFHVYNRQMELPRKGIAQAVQTYTRPGAETIGTGAIGIVGYYCPTHRIIDYGGLVTPREVLDDRQLRPSLLNVRVGDVPDGYRCVYMVPSGAGGGPDQLLWARTDGATTWDPTRVGPSTQINASFGPDVTLIGVAPDHTRARPGDSIRFKVLWRFGKALPKGRLISYYLGCEQIPVAAYNDMSGFFRNVRPNHAVTAGEAVLDTVEMTIPTATASGHYQVSVMIYPTDGFEVDEQHRSRVHFTQCRLFDIDIVGPGAR